MPISGLNLTIVGTELGAITNPGGQFLMSGVPTGNQVLQIVRLGYGVTNLPITVGAGELHLGRIPVGCDHVRAPGNTFDNFDPAYGPESVLLLDGRLSSGSCVNDRLHTDGPAAISVFSFQDNVVAAAGTPCSSEVAVFSAGNAALYSPNPPEWSTATGDRVTRTLAQPISVPLNIWLAVDATQMNAAAAQAAADILLAEDLYDANRIGVTFSENIAPATAGMITIGDDCAEAIGNGIAGTAWYTAGELNVYYVKQAFLDVGGVFQTTKGVSCGADRNIIFVSASGDATTLAHEIGHAFGLLKARGHTDKTWTVTFAQDPTCADQDPLKDECQPACDASWGPDALPTKPGCQMFTPANVMYDDAAGRTEFTIGQAYQMNLHALSQLNVNGHRTGPTRTCEALPQDNAVCPMLWIDP